jgi:hypothetical protein
VPAKKQAGSIFGLQCSRQKATFLSRVKTACIKVMLFILKAVLIIFCLMYSIRLVNLWRKGKLFNRKRSRRSRIESITKGCSNEDYRLLIVEAAIGHPARK